MKSSSLVGRGVAAGSSDVMGVGDGHDQSMSDLLSEPWDDDEYTAYLMMQPLDSSLFTSADRIIMLGSAVESIATPISINNCRALDDFFSTLR